MSSGERSEEQSTRSEIVPPVMWPDSGSGFEADGFSPAGSAQLGARFYQGLGRRRFGHAAAWVLVGIFVLIPIVSLAIAFLTRH